MVTRPFLWRALAAVAGPPLLATLRLFRPWRLGVRTCAFPSGEHVELAAGGDEAVIRSGRRKSPADGALVQLRPLGRGNVVAVQVVAGSCSAVGELHALNLSATAAKITWPGVAKELGWFVLSDGVR